MAEIASVPLRGVTDAAYTSRWRSRHCLGAFSAMSADPVRQANYLDNATGTPSALTQALSLLRSTGGQLYMAGPANREASDGSGVAPDGIGTYPIGWVRDSVAGTNNAYQATTAAKPKLVREPILGPELVVNGDFSAGTTGWTGNAQRAVVSVASGEGLLTTTLNNGVQFAASAEFSLVTGKIYQCSWQGRLGTATGGRFAVKRGGAGGYVSYQTQDFTNTAMQQRTIVFTATGADTICQLQLNPTQAVGATAIFDNISVREILGYKDVWSWEFDGVDDKLQGVMPSLAGASNNGVLMCCAYTSLGAAVQRAFFLGNSVSHFKLAQMSNGAIQPSTQSAAGGVTYGTLAPWAVGETGVITFYTRGGILYTRKNGVLVGAGSAFTPGVFEATVKVGIGGDPDGTNANCRIQAPVICAGITTLAEVQQIERAVAAAAGITLP